MKHDMSYLKDLPIAVLGGGAVGKTCAADMKLAGREVRLYSRTPKAVANLDKTGILLDGVQRNLYGFERSGRAFLDLASTDMAEVVKGAGLIVIGITANAQEHYLRTLVPLLEDGQVVHIFTDNYATLLLRRFMREAGCTKKVIVGGWSSAPYGTRLEKIGGFTMPHVGAKYRAITLRGATQPMTDIDDFLESAKYLPCMDAVTHGDGPVAGDTVLDIGFSNVNPVIHVPASCWACRAWKTGHPSMATTPTAIPCTPTGCAPPSAECSISSIRKNVPLPTRSASASRTMPMSHSSPAAAY